MAEPAKSGTGFVSGIGSGTGAVIALGISVLIAFAFYFVIGWAIGKGFKAANKKE